MSNSTIVNLSGKKIEILNDYIPSPINFDTTELNLSNNNIKILPKSFTLLKALKSLDLTANKIENIEHVILILSKLPELEELNIDIQNQKHTNMILDMCEKIKKLNGDEVDEISDNEMLAGSESENQFSLIRMLHCQCCGIEFDLEKRSCRILPCFHKYCEHCIATKLTKWSLSGQMDLSKQDYEMIPDLKNGVLKCPECQTEIITENGLYGNNGLFVLCPKDFRLAKALIHWKHHCYQHDTRCDECSDDNTNIAIFGCFICQKALCKFHTESHARTKATKNHEVATIADYCQAAQNKIDMLFCEQKSIHPPLSTQASVIYDLLPKQLITQCRTELRQMKDHVEFISAYPPEVSMAVKNYKDHLTNLKTAGANEQVRIDQTVKSFQNVVDALDKRNALIESEIKREIQKAHDEIKLRETQLLETLSTVYEDKKSIISDQIQLLKRIQNEMTFSGTVVSDLINQADFKDLFSVGGILELKYASLCDELNQKDIKPVPQISDIDFKPGMFSEMKNIYPKCGAIISCSVSPHNCSITSEWLPSPPCLNDCRMDLNLKDSTGQIVKYSDDKSIPDVTVQLQQLSNEEKNILKQTLDQLVDKSEEHVRNSLLSLSVRGPDIPVKLLFDKPEKGIVGMLINVQRLGTFRLRVWIGETEISESPLFWESDSVDCFFEKRVSPGLQIANEGSTISSISGEEGNEWSFAIGVRKVQYTQSYKWNIVVEKMGITKNVWKLLLGVTSNDFSNTYALVCGTGQKTNNFLKGIPQGQGEAYYETENLLQKGSSLVNEKMFVSDRFVESDDVITIQLNANENGTNTLIFFKNGKSLGVAYSNLVGPLLLYVAMSGPHRIRIQSDS